MTQGRSGSQQCQALHRWVREAVAAGFSSLHGCCQCWTCVHSWEQVDLGGAELDEAEVRLVKRLKAAQRAKHAARSENASLSARLAALERAGNAAVAERDAALAEAQVGAPQTLIPMPPSPLTGFTAGNAALTERDAAQAEAQVVPPALFSETPLSGLERVRGFQGCADQALAEAKIVPPAPPLQNSPMWGGG